MPRRGPGPPLPVLAALGLLPALLACGAREPAAPAGRRAVSPDLLVVTIDTLRPDALGWVSQRATTPEIDALAAAGAAFPAAVAPVPLTLPSHVSMFSGLVPRRHGVRDNHQVLGGAPPLLAERLREAGYATAAVVSGFPLSPEFGLDRGFDRYDARLTAGEGAWLERPAGETAAAAVAWLEARPDRAKPWLLWVHFYDPHFPYEPPPAHRGGGERGGYDGEARYVDAELAALLAAARRTSRGELLTVLTADHGESLGEHGEGTHGFFIYDSTILVPLIFHWPGRLAPARRDEPARLVDLAPTLLELLGLPALDDADGVSLVPLLEGRDLQVPPAYLETLQPWSSYGWAPLAALRTAGWKLIAAPRPELYDLAADPGEGVNLYRPDAARARELGRLLRRRESREPAPDAAAADPDTLERLAALGYVGATATGPMPPRESLADPKERIELRELLTRADALLRAGAAAEAETLFRQVLEREPDNRFARVRLGIALHRRGDPAAALPELERAARLAPDDPQTRRAHAEALDATRRHARAAEEWMEVVRLLPRDDEAWSRLGTSLGLAGRPGDALPAFERAVELAPADAGRRIRLAFAAHAAEDRQRALAELRAAAGLTGAEAFPHPGALGLLLLESGDRAAAREWLARSAPAEGDYPAARFALVRLALAAGDREGARRLLAETLERRPDLAGRASAEPAFAELLR